MLSKLNSFGLLTLFVMAFLLLTCFMGSAAFAGGGGGEVPPPPPVLPNGVGSDGGDGTSIVVAFITILQLFL